MKDIFAIVESEEPKNKEHIRLTQYRHHINMIKTHVNTNYTLKTGILTRLKHSNFLKPTRIHKWDVLAAIASEDFDMPHPHLVFKVTKDYVYAACTSSNGTKEHSIFAFKKSRFWAGKFLTHTVRRFTHEEAVNSFVGTFDHKAEAAQAVTTLNNYYKNVFK